MKRAIRYALLAAMFVLVAACAGGGRLVKAGAGVRVFDLAFDTDLDWARNRWSRFEFWTIDGQPLNEFVVVSKVRPNEHVFLEARERKRRPDGPWYRPGMRPDELRDVLLDAMRQDGWTQVSASHLRPARFGNVDGLRFEIELTHVNGLRYRGMVAAAEHDGKLTHWFWIAPVEYYYGRDAAAVEKMFASARFVD
jgi:hypothetical protein